MFEVSAWTDATPEQVWTAWVAVGDWPVWDAGISWVRLEGPFAQGTQGRLKPKGGPAVPFEITRCEPGVGFSDRSRLPLCKLDFDHTLTVENGRTKITNRATFSGPLAWLFSRLIGGDFPTELPKTVASLAAYAARRVPDTHGAAR